MRNDGPFPISRHVIKKKSQKFQLRVNPFEKKPFIVEIMRNDLEFFVDFSIGQFEDRSSLHTYAERHFRP